MDTKQKELIISWLKELENHADLERVRAEQASEAENYQEHELEIARHEQSGFHLAVRYVRQMLEFTSPENLPENL